MSGYIERGPGEGCRLKSFRTDSRETGKQRRGSTQILAARLSRRLMGRTHGNLVIEGRFCSGIRAFLPGLVDDGMNGTTPKGGDNEPRPHFVPITDRRRQLLQIEISGFFGHTGLCPGQITPDRSPGRITPDRSPRTDHPGQITPDRSPRTDHPGQITPDRSPRTDHPGRITPDGSPRTDHPGQITPDRSPWKTAARSTHSAPSL